MSRRDNYFDNACIENFFGYLKSKLIYQNNYKKLEKNYLNLYISVFSVIILKGLVVN